MVIVIDATVKRNQHHQLRYLISGRTKFEVNVLVFVGPHSTIWEKTTKLMAQIPELLGGFKYFLIFTPTWGDGPS